MSGSAATLPTRMGLTRLDELLDRDRRPLSYWHESDPRTLKLDRVKGTIRGQLLRQSADREDLDSTDDKHVNEGLPESELIAWGKLGPAFMGGEYLPDLDNLEVEIARISMASTTGDVISIRARPSGNSIHYRVRDEYESEYTCTPKVSDLPLSFGEMISLIDATGLIIPVLGRIYWDSNDRSTENLEDFISVSSNFYSGLGNYYSNVVSEWLENKNRENELEKIEADEEYRELIGELNEENEKKGIRLKWTE